jgi:transcriptional regulator with XRE-family HTH domain
VPSTPANHDAHDYAERIRERLPRRHQELREGIGLSMYALWLKGGVSRDTISRIEGGETIPGVHVLARLAWGLGVTLEKFFGGMEDRSVRPEYRTNRRHGACALIGAIPAEPCDEADSLPHCLDFASGGRFPATYPRVFGGRWRLRGGA